MHSFSLIERIIFFGVATVMAASAIALFSYVQANYLVTTPRLAGSLSEGIVGSPRFINPILATTDADRDLVSLVYAGLLRTSPNGSLVPELAESYTTDNQGASYTFTLRADATFHDGTPVTADDVIFTIEKVQDPNLKSPKWASWVDVVAEKIDDRTVRLSPKAIYAPFLQNATLGILPKAYWKNITAEQFPFSPLNIEPVGAGPYRIDFVEEQKNGVPSSFLLTPFKSYALQTPYIRKLMLHFYQNETALLEAYKKGEIEAMSSISPENALLLDQTNATVLHTPLLRVFGIYFNTSKSTALANKEVRQALLLVTDKKTIVDTVLHGFGTQADEPIPPGLLIDRKTKISTTTESGLIAARKLLEKNGWKLSTTTNIYEKKTKTETQTLSFSIALPNAPDLKAAADMVVSSWRELGADVTLSVFEPGDLHQNVIRPRKYDALLFGQIIGRDLDVYPFWHSSQRNDPGYNISMYANVTVDKLLEEARKTTDTEARTLKYLQFEEEIANDVPAIFLYSPDFIYVLPKKLHAVNLGSIAVPAERFASIKDWYIETDRIWSPLIPLLSR